MVTLVNKVRDEAAQAVCNVHGNRPEELLEILHNVQESQGFLSDDALRTIAYCLNISQAEIHGVVSFYHDYKRTQGAAVTIKICQAEACQAVGCASLVAAAEARFGVKIDEGASTPPSATPNGATGGRSPGGDIALEAVYCLGNCALGPAALIGEQLIGLADIDRLDAAVGHARALLGISSGSAA